MPNDNTYDITDSYRDAESKKFTGSKSGDTAIRTVIDNVAAIPVASSPNDNWLILYSEVLAVAAGATVSVIAFAVPAGKTFYIKSTSYSGDNIATYESIKNSVVHDKVRTYWGNFNGSTDFGFLKLDAGDVVSVEVENFRNSVSDFNAKITGILV